MQTLQILKRRDASSVVAAIVLAFIIWGAVSALAERPAAWLTGTTTQGGGWRAGLWEPLVLLVVELLVLELAVRAYVLLAGAKK